MDPVEGIVADAALFGILPSNLNYNLKKTGYTINNTHKTNRIEWSSAKRINIFTMVPAELQSHK
jgi:hypothetical protein